MNSVVRRLVDMAVRVRDFFRTNPFGSESADAVVDRFEAAVARARDLIAQQAAGELDVHTSSVVRAGIRRDLTKNVLRHLSRIAGAAAKEKPDLSDSFRQPLSTANDQKFRAVVEIIRTETAANRELLVKYGLWEGALDELNRHVEALDQAAIAGNAGRRAHTGASTELKIVGSELVAFVRQLDGMMIFRLREHPDLRGAWASARNVAWPLPGPAEKPPVVPGGTG